MTKPFIQGQGEDFDNESKLPIHLKMLLTIREAAEYSNIGINKIDSMLKQPNCPFVLYVGTRKLVKRKEFEELSIFVCTHFGILMQLVRLRVGCNRKCCRNC